MREEWVWKGRRREIESERKVWEGWGMGKRLRRRGRFVWTSRGGKRKVRLWGRIYGMRGDEKGTEMKEGKMKGGKEEKWTDKGGIGKHEGINTHT